MLVFLLVLLAASIVGGLAGGELTDRTFSVVGAIIGGVGTGAVLLALGALIDAQERRRQAAALPQDMRVVFDRMMNSPVLARAASDPVLLSRAALREVEAQRAIPGLEVVKEKVLALLHDRPRTEASIRDDHLSPRALIYLLVTNVAFDELASGRHHVYRGVLDHTGTQLRQAFTAASALMVACGAHDQAAHVAEIAGLARVIAEAG